MEGTEVKKILLLLIIVLWPTTVKATLFSYELSVTMLAGYLAQPLFGDVRVGVGFVQETTLDFPQTSFFLPDLTLELYPYYSINGYQNRGLWSLSQVSLLDYRIWVGDPGGNVYFDLLYDQVQAPNAPFREPDRLGVNFGAEFAPPPGWCNTPTTFPCPIGTGGTHTFEQGEFSFASSHEIAEPAALVLLACGLLLMGLRRANG